MDERFALAGKGLWFLFLSVILNLIGNIVGIVPLLGGAAEKVLEVAAFALSLYGPWSAREAHPNFLNAFYASIVGAALNVVDWFIPEESTFLAVVVGIVAIVVSVLEVYFICSASRDLLREKGDQPLADRADLIWKLVAGCSAVVLASLLLVWIPGVNLLAGVASLVASIVLIVAMILEVLFYYKGANSLKAA